MWIDVKSTWDLTATDAEVTALDEMLETCFPSLAGCSVRGTAP